MCIKYSDITVDEMICNDPKKYFSLKILPLRTCANKYDNPRIKYYHEIITYMCIFLLNKMRKNINLN